MHVRQYMDIHTCKAMKNQCTRVCVCMCVCVCVHDDETLELVEAIFASERILQHGNLLLLCQLVEVPVCVCVCMCVCARERERARERESESERVLSHCSSFVVCLCVCCVCVCARVS